jgi:hypothetical protein
MPAFYGWRKTSISKLCTLLFDAHSGVRHFDSDKFASRFGMSRRTRLGKVARSVAQQGTPLQLDRAALPAPVESHLGAG